MASDTALKVFAELLVRNENQRLTRELINGICSTAHQALTQMEEQPAEGASVTVPAPAQPAT